MIRAKFRLIIDSIAFADGHTTLNVYDADGRKLRTIHVVAYDPVMTPGGQQITPTDTIVRDYCAGFIYDNGELERLLTPSGYYADGKYHYYIRDYQGNNVAVVTRTNNVADVVSATLTYPYGGELTELSATDRYRFGGKELDTRGGLFHYDFGARHYDPVLPMFNGYDPMAEKYYHLSPLAYCAGNPVRYIDPSEEDPIYIEKDGEIILIGDNGKTDQIAYLVQGRVAESVQQSKDKYYNGDLTEGEDVFTIPMGDVMVRMKDTVDRACEVERETGGHFMSGSETPFIWDEGAGISEDGTSSSVKAFIVGGKHTNPSKAENIAWIWHVHHPSSVKGEFGNSNPSEDDITFHKDLIQHGYKGNSILIGGRVKEVSLYNNTGVLKKTSLSNFYKMGEILK